MRVSGINTDVSFKRVTKEAAKAVFQEPTLLKKYKEDNKTVIKNLITKGYGATHYDVGYNANDYLERYYIYRNDKGNKNINAMGKHPYYGIFFDDVVEESLKLEKNTLIYKINNVQKKHKQNQKHI